MSGSPVNVVDLHPVESLIDRPEANVTPTLWWDNAAGYKFGRRIIGFVGQVRASPYRNSCLAEKRLRASIVNNAHVNGDWLIGNDRSRVDPVDLRIYRGALALNESPSLNPADPSQNNRKKPHDTGPVDHGPVKGILMLALMALGGWIGVWSIGFWDWLGPSR